MRKKNEKMIRELTDKQLFPSLKKVLILRFFENKTFEELSEIFGVSESVVKRMINRALRKLKNLEKENNYVKK